MRRSTVKLFCALFVVGLLSSACRTGPYVWVQNVPPEKKTQTAPGAGVIAVGDLVEVKVYGEDSFTTRARVRNDGIITLPLLGQVPVLGETPPNLASTLSTRLKPFITDPRVMVVILESEINVTVLGEVKQVGVLTLPAPATVLQALAKAGGLTDFADGSKIFVVRTHGSKSQRIRFTYDALLAGDPASVGFRLQTGDVLVVE